MPWLQEPSVIYHHPLDSVAESRRLKNWTLVKGSFSSGKVPSPPPAGMVGEPDDEGRRERLCQYDRIHQVGLYGLDERPDLTNPQSRSWQST